MATLDDFAAIRAELQAGEHAPREARRALAPLEHTLTPELKEAVALVTSELVTNSVRHSSAGGASRIELEAVVDDGIVRVSVSDDGRGFEPAAAPEPGYVGGWGLQVVDQLVERWWIERDAGTRVVCELARA